jgi:hypothetical protein
MALPALGAAVAVAVATASTYVIPWLIRVLFFTLGLSVITMIGLDYAFDYARDLIMARYEGLPATLVDWLDYLGVFDAFSIIFSAINASLALRWLCGNAEGKGKRKKIDFSC